jgi:hypothetical protein
MFIPPSSHPVPRIKIKGKRKKRPLTLADLFRFMVRTFKDGRKTDIFLRSLILKKLGMVSQRLRTLASVSYKNLSRV